MLHQAMQARHVDGTSSDSDHASSVPEGDPATLSDPDMQGHGHIAAPQFASPAGPAMHPDDEPGRYDHAVHHDADTHADQADDEVSDRQDGLALFSTATDRSVTGAFNTLAAMRLADNSEDLLGLARDMIRPLLKSWLERKPARHGRAHGASRDRARRAGRPLDHRPGPMIQVPVAHQSSR